MGKPEGPVCLCGQRETREVCSAQGGDGHQVSLSGEPSREGADCLASLSGRHEHTDRALVPHAGCSTKRAMRNCGAPGSSRVSGATLAVGGDENGIDVRLPALTDPTSVVLRAGPGEKGLSLGTHMPTTSWSTDLCKSGVHREASKDAEIAVQVCEREASLSGRESGREPGVEAQGDVQTQWGLETSQLSKWRFDANLS